MKQADAERTAAGTVAGNIHHDNVQHIIGTVFFVIAEDIFLFFCRKNAAHDADNRKVNMLES